ncbi:hypothetical protein C7H19_15380 [Aphanothece hegewaldii CCALA 016]|uniref:Uncharacterized protein n=1 Tax=Aphanothece hegewaldii CCALA 016 TaxID=2107694 RepID=A0A2T1LW05_9CHRO|nr:hypothetical protein [Aphanothece hegewaldii]PSF35805.1 hypothetical protein C7H19_15380 [Aphanothece hegewaldii CCALA 016]
MYIKKPKDRILWSIPEKPALVQILANGRNVGMIADTGQKSKVIRPLLNSLLKQIQNRPSNIDLIEVYFDDYQVLKLTSLKKTVVNELKLFYQYYPRYLTWLMDNDRFIVKPPTFLLEWEKDFCGVAKIIKGR